MSADGENNGNGNDNNNASGSGGVDSGPGRREVAYRFFAAEFDDASLSYSESDEERAPNYVVTPTGLRVNRLFAVGVLTEVERINTDTLRGRIVDPTGAFVTYAGQYQPEAQAFLDSTTPPTFMAITGKARTFEPDDSDRVFTSVRPESLSEVSADTRDRWVVSAAEQTLERIAVFAAALQSPLRDDALRIALAEAGVSPPLAAGIPLALAHYGTTTAYLEAMRQLAVDALEVVAGERDEVRSLSVAPGDSGDAPLGPLPDISVDLSAHAVDDAESAHSVDDAESELSTETTPETGAETTPDATTETTPETGSDAYAEESNSSSSPAADEEASTADSEPVTESSPEIEPESEPEAEPEAESVTADSSSDAVADSEPDESVVEPTDTASADMAPTDSTATDTGVEDSGMYQLDDTEREELEAEFGSGFSSGNDIDPAGEADIDVPDVDELAEQAEQTEQGAATESSAAESSPVESTPDADADSAETADEPDTLGSFEDELGEFEDPTDDPVERVASDDETTAQATETDADSADGTDESGDDTDDATDIDLEDTAVELMAELDDGDGADREKIVSTIVDSYGVDPEAVDGAIADALMSGRCYEPGDGVLKSI